MLLLQASLQVSSGGTNKLMQGMACGTDFNCVITSDLSSRFSPSQTFMHVRLCWTMVDVLPFRHESGLRRKMALAQQLHQHPTS